MNGKETPQGEGKTGKVRKATKGGEETPKVKGKKSMVPRDTPQTNMQEFDGAAVVAAALQGGNIKVRDDLEFRYESLGGGLAAHCALRILGVKASCMLATAGRGRLP
jgi:hypothetical protein